MGAALAGRLAGATLKPLLRAASRRRLPQVDGRIYVPNLRRPVTIRRDKWGIPHIHAHSRHDLFLAQGYVHAQDRLWQMELNRRAASGQLSALFGRQTLQIDRICRTLGFGRAAEKSWHELAEGIRMDVEAYAKGVNAFLAGRGELPVEFSLVRHRPNPWRPRDSLAYARLQMWALSHGAMGELVQAKLLEVLGPEKAKHLGMQYPDENPVTLPDGIDVGKLVEKPVSLPALVQFMGKGNVEGGGRGSNGWVISGKLSESGRPILSNDMHLPVGTPSLWYYVHLRSDDGFHASGFSQPGLPYVLVGHNEHIAWGATLSYCDCEDLFMEEISADEPTRYRFRNAWREAAILEERIEVRGSGEHVEKVVLTHHGPLVGHLFAGKKQAVALSSKALQAKAGFEGFAMLNEARDWHEFVTAVSHIQAPSLNLLYADVRGNIGHYVSGQIPIRAKGDGTVPAPGWTGEYEWVGNVPFAEMPHALNPKQGYIVSANHRLVGNDYPHFLGRVWRNGYRARRIEHMIAAKDKVSPDDCQRFQLDVFCIPGYELAGILGESQPSHPDARLSLRLLSEWDGWLNPDSVGGAVYEVLMLKLARAILSPHLVRQIQLQWLGLGPHPILSPVNEFQGYWPVTLLRLLRERDAYLLPDRQTLIEGCLRESTETLRLHLGDNWQQWQWGHLHRIRFAHAFSSQAPLDQVFDQGPFPLGGDGDTVAQAAIRPDLPYDNNAISVSSRQVVDLGDFDNSRAMLAPGQSGRLASQHYGSMIQPWLTGGYFRMSWDDASVTAACHHELRLIPVNALKTQPRGGDEG